MSLSDDHRCIREHAAIGAIAARTQIALSGKDRASYLQGLLTNDIQGLTAGTGCYAAWLTPQGRMQTDLHVLESGDMILLDVPAERAEQALQLLDQFLFSEDVQIGDLRADLRALWLHGPGAAATFERVVTGATGLSSWLDYRNARFEYGAAPLVLVRIDQLGVPGFCAYVATSEEPSLRAALAHAGAHEVAPEAIEAARVAAGYPVFGVDMDEDTIPLEAGIEPRAISLTKGCYVGQEVIIRVLHRGHGRVARKLVMLQMDGEPPARGARVLSDTRDVGFITSAAQVPLENTRALGYLHRDFVSAGTRVEVQTTGGTAPALVIERAPIPAS